MIDKSGLRLCFEVAMLNKSNWIALELTGTNTREIVLVPNANFKKDLKLITEDYSKWLRYLGFKEREITGYAYADTTKEAVELLEG